MAKASGRSYAGAEAAELAADQAEQRLIKQLGPRTPESHIEDIIVPNTTPLAGGSQGDNYSLGYTDTGASKDPQS